ncbi:MAG: hypothetical protein EOP87_15795 [Verrucomicrobiaceae bacterium]|nr:MAG: hypothetical protein EOP87_15795 [Verrucomicrobiaceae bacterium]
MRLPAILLSAATAALLSSCATRTEFTPEKSQTTVGMPAKLSDRESSYISQVDGSLRNQGYLPVRHGTGDMQLDFGISEGPINTDTSIRLSEGRTTVAEGEGRAAGAPLIGRDKVAERSFTRAFEAFEASLPNASAAGQHHAEEQGEQEYVY